MTNNNLSNNRLIKKHDSCLPDPCHYKLRYCEGPIGPTGATGPMGPTGDTGPTGPFLSNYMEALGNGQLIGVNEDIVFDTNSIDCVGNGITLSDDGKVFTINKTGLYIVEWNVNLAHNPIEDIDAVIGIIENGNVASGSNSKNFGNFASGTLINVDTIPFTISLHNFNNEITIENPTQWENTAASIRIVRFADGPSV